MDKCDKLELALLQFADQSNWECNEEYGKYGIFWTYTWLGDDDPWNIAKEALDDEN